MICDITNALHSNEAKSLKIFVGLVSSATVGAAATRVLSAPSPQSQDHVIRWPLHNIFIMHIFLLSIQNTHLQLLSQALAQGSRGKRTIDLDGGGPLPPASLLCDFDNDGQVVSKVEDLLNKETIICDVNSVMLKRWKWRQCWWHDVVVPLLHVVFAKVEHDLKEETKVDGFQEPGSFSQRVTYLAPKEVRANKFQQIKFDQSRVQDSFWKNTSPRWLKGWWRCLWIADSLSPTSAATLDFLILAQVNTRFIRKDLHKLSWSNSSLL